MSDLAADLELIRAAAVTAGDLALAEREAGLKIWSKSGGSPVTSADMAVDRLLRDALLGARPDRRLWVAGRAKIDDWGSRPAAELHLDDAAWAD